MRLFSAILILTVALSACEKSGNVYFEDDSRVEIVDIDSATLHALMLNDSQNLRVLNIWATWCRPCLEEFPVFVELHKKYDGQDFEFIAVSADEQKDRIKVLNFLKKQNGVIDSFIFESDSVYQLIYNESLGWNGSLPFTIVVDEQGRVLYRVNEAIEPESFVKLIEKQISSKL